jgi:hypothetical protein
MVDQDSARERLVAGLPSSVTAIDPVQPTESLSAPRGSRPDPTAEFGVGEVVAAACVRIRHRDGTVVDSGFLVGPTLVATCAHVVADALGIDPGVENPPAGQLAIELPMVRDSAASRTAEMARWDPIAEDGDGDVALLGLSEPAPRGALTAPVRRIGALWGHRYRMFGFPEGRMDGVWSTGVIRGAQATGWFQLQGAVGDQPVRGGFSGSPVWDDRTGPVVGMTAAADRDAEVTTAYLIPSSGSSGSARSCCPAATGASSRSRRSAHGSSSAVIRRSSGCVRQSTDARWWRSSGRPVPASRRWCAPG